MRKTLLATAAVFIAAGAHADEMMESKGVEVSGSAGFGVAIDGSESGSEAFSFIHNFNITFAASGTTDAGMAFGASTTLGSNESVTADFTGDDVSVKSGPVIVTGTSAGTVESTSIFATIKLDNAEENGEEFCWIGQDGRWYQNSDLTADPVAVKDETTALFDVPIFGNYTSAAAVFKSLNMDMPTDEDEDNFMVIRDDVSSTNDEDETYVIYRVDTALSEACGDATFVSTGLLTDGKPLTGVSVDSTVADISSTGAVTGKVSGSLDNNATVYIEMGGNKLTIGDVSAADKLAGGIADVGFDGVGADDAGESLYGKTAADIRFDGSFGVATVAATVGGDSAWAAGFSFSVAPVTVGIGFDSLRAASVGLGLSQGGISANVIYTSKSGDTAMGVDTSYQMSDATSVTIAYSQESAEDGDGLGIGFSHDLGGGATLKAGAGQKDGQTNADLGISMSF